MLRRRLARRLRRWLVETLEPRRVLDSTVVFNELMYNPAGADELLEWVELHNQQGVDMDISGWRLSGGVDYTFASGTVIRGRGHLVVALDPTALGTVTGFTTALGPFSGNLSNSGEVLRLLNNSDRQMDEVEFGDSGEWPISPDGSGASLAKRAANLGSEPAASWTTSAQVGGTPGAANFSTASQSPTVSTLIEPDAAWRYDASGANLGVAWVSPEYVDDAWNSGGQLLYAGDAELNTGVVPGGVLANPGAGLTNYWPLEQTSGTTAPNSVAGGTTASMFNGVTWINDATRGRVLQFDGVDGYASAGTTPAISPTAGFTMSFWSRQIQAAPPNRPNDVILGNRFPDSGWSKFTPSAFEYRDIAPSFNNTIDYPDLAPAAWVHHAVVKSGSMMTYYRNGVAIGNTLVTATMPARPFYFGGDTTNENWNGVLDDIATWNKALPAQAIAGIASGQYTPATAPTDLVGAGTGDTSPGPVVFAEDFSAPTINAAEWEIVDQGLENSGPAGYNSPSTTTNAGRLTLSGTQNAQYWYGSSIRTRDLHDTQDRVTVAVDRVSLDGTGTAYRSSLWLWGDSGHYVHFSQNINEGGWSYNSNDVGGNGTLNPTGGGNILSAFSALHGNTAQQEMKIVYEPIASGRGTISLYLNNVLGASVSVTNWPSKFQVMLTGQARAAGDSVTAVFDNLKINVNSPPTTPPSIVTPVVSDNFTADTINAAIWSSVEYGLETRTAGSAANITANTTTNSDRLTLGGAATTNYWGGRSLRSVATFPSNVETTFTVDRLLLSGSGTAYRSSIWLWASDTNYVHFSQNVGETGWQYNVNNVGGTGTLNPTGSATNIVAFDTLDADLGAKQMKLAFKPTGTAGAATIEIYLDGTLGATHNVTNWPSQFQVMLTGQARQAGDTVNAVFDNALVTQSRFPSLTTELPIGATTYYFRNEFEFDGDPGRATLLLSPLADDGAVYYLNGVEIYRQNMPLGEVASSTFAATTIGNAGYARTVTLPATALVDGQNVLAVEVHQAGAADSDMLFGAKLAVSVRPADPTKTPPVLFNELAAAADPMFWLELTNPGTGTVDLTGYTIASSNELHTPYAFPQTTLGAGQFLVVTQAQLGFQPADADHLFLYNADGTAVLDGVLVKNRWQGRSSAHDGRWQFPNATTPGAANSFDFENDVVINEIMYHHRPDYATPDMPPTFNLPTTLVPINQTWKYNRSGQDLGATWYQVNHVVDGTNWRSGQALLGVEPDAVPGSIPPVPILTTWPTDYDPNITTYYFQTEFNVAADVTGAQLRMRHIIDDGAIFYLNGIELTRSPSGLSRYLMGGAAPTYTTPATFGVNNAIYSSFVELNPAPLLTGNNVLSVEVHQQNTAAGRTDVLFGMELILQTQATPFIPGEPFEDNPEEWVELYNRGDETVDLSGWDFGSGIDYVFPQGTMLAPGGYLVVSNNAAALSATLPTVAILGNFGGSLSRSGERIELRDAAGNIADQVHYHDDKPWPLFADGGGSSLELRDPRADNSKAESWAASDESAGSSWQTITYSGPATNLVGPSNYNEFILGLLDAGEVLIDDVSVIQDPFGVPKQLIQNGNFQSGAATFWRLLGNHDDSLVITDPTDPGGVNKVLKIVATGPTEHMHNHLETTLKDGANYVTINPALTYQISFRSKWVTGSPQINSRLYFSRLQRTSILDVPNDTGTPGGVNSRFTANTGPTYDNLSHFPVVPQANENVTISVAASDPDGVATMNLRYSVAGGAFATMPMTLSDGMYRAVIPGHAAATVVQFYVEGQDSLGATSTYPAAGAASRALYKVNDGAVRPGGGHDITIIMTTADADAMHTVTDVMSNGLRGATVVYDNEEVFYDVGIRLKGSEHGRFQSVRVGYVIRFHADQLFRGVEDSIAIDRSGAGDQYSQKEILIKHALNRVGDLPTMYDDLIDIVAPRSAQNGSAMLGMSRYDNDFLDSQYEDGSDGTAFEYELIYVLVTTTGGPEGLKIPAADTVVGVPLASLGTNKEAYRWDFIIENNRDADDYSKLMEALAAIGQPAGTQFYTDTNRLLDVDEWLRAFALTSLFAVGDNYVTGAQHNLILYTRPGDGKTMFFPHDMDFTFTDGATSALIRNNDLTKLTSLPANRRAFYGHVHDMITTIVNSAYMNQWVAHYDSFLPAEDFSGFATFIATRQQNAMTQITAAIPQSPFAITTPNNTSFASSTATINGNGWVNVRALRLAGEEAALPVTWSTNTGWTATVPIEFGTHPITIEAYDFQDQLIGTATITVTSTVSDRPLQDFLRVTELMYHPADAPELGLDADEFEFIELRNISTSTTLDLSDARISQGVDFDFSEGAITSLAPGGYVLLVSNAAAFAQRYDNGFPIAGEYSGQLNNTGERLRIEDINGVAIHDFVYDDTGEGWYPETDGDGYSLVIRDENALVASWNDAASWRASHALSGSPAAADLPTLEGDLNGDARVDLIDLSLLQSHLGTPSGATQADGDINGDGAVTGADVAAMTRNYGRSLPPPSPSPALAAILAEKPRRSALDRGRPPAVAAARRMVRAASPLPRANLTPSAVDCAIEGDEVGGTVLRAARR